MILGKFNKKLMEYPDEKLLAAYEELQVLDETGAFPSNAKIFQELVRERQKMYNTSYSLDATRSDILDEIARRWHYDKKDLYKVFLENKSVRESTDEDYKRVNNDTWICNQLEDLVVKYEKYLQDDVGKDLTNVELSRHNELLAVVQELKELLYKYELDKR